MIPRAKGGVVSPQLKVYGTSNVRVVDVSVITFSTASNMLTAFILDVHPPIANQRSSAIHHVRNVSLHQFQSSRT